MVEIQHVAVVSLEVFHRLIHHQIIQKKKTTTLNFVLLDRKGLLNILLIPSLVTVNPVSN